MCALTPKQSLSLLNFKGSRHNVFKPGIIVLVLRACFKVGGLEIGLGVSDVGSRIWRIGFRT